MKKLLSMLLIFLMPTSCGTDPLANVDSQTSKVSETTTYSRKKEITTEATPEMTVKLLQYQIAKDYKGRDIIVFDFDFYNGSNEPEEFIWNFSVKLFQNGIECDDAYSTQTDIYDSGLGQKEILPGYNLTVQEAFILSDLSEVQLIVTDLIGDDVYINGTITLQNNPLPLQ